MKDAILASGAALLFATATLSAQASAPEENSSFAKTALGAALYEENCARCHGTEMLDPSGSFFDLRTFPADQRSRFMNSVANGKNSMPPWRSVLSKEEIGSLFDYVIAGRNKE